MPEETVGQRIVRLAAANPSLPTERKALAERMGVEYETLRKWTIGASAPSRRRAAIVATVLGVPEEIVMHGAPTDGIPDADSTTALDRALEVVGEALAAAPAGDRPELADLMRQWAAWGGRAIYLSAIAELMNRGREAQNLGALLRPLTPEAARIARIMDRLSSAGRSRLYAMAQAIAQEDGGASSPAIDQHPAPPGR